MIKRTITLELFDLQTKNSELSLKEKLLNQVKEDDETIKNVNKNNRILVRSRCSRISKYSFP